MLNTYIDNVNKIKKDIDKKSKPLGKLALNGAEDPITKDDPAHAGYDFAQVNFEETPVIAALAVLSNFQTVAVKWGCALKKGYVFSKYMIQET